MINKFVNHNIQLCLVHWDGRIRGGFKRMEKTHGTRI